MIKQGLKHEVESLIELGCSNKNKSMRSIGYKEMLDHIQNGTDINETIRLINKNTHALAKRQITWFKKRDFTAWFHPEKDKELIFKTAIEFLTD